MADNAPDTTPAKKAVKKAPAKKAVKKAPAKKVAKKAPTKKTAKSASQTASSSSSSTSQSSKASEKASFENETPSAPQDHLFVMLGNLNEATKNLKQAFEHGSAYIQQASQKKAEEFVVEASKTADEYQKKLAFLSKIYKIRAKNAMRETEDWIAEHPAAATALASALTSLILAALTRRHK